MDTQTFLNRGFTIVLALVRGTSELQTEGSIEPFALNPPFLGYCLLEPKKRHCMHDTLYRAALEGTNPRYEPTP